MLNNKRISGIEIVGDVPWGTHFCQFYRTKEDLVDILVPYFKAGLENNEFCMWITSKPLVVADAKAALAGRVTNLDEYIRKGQLEILDYSEWHTRSGKFIADEVLQGWLAKESTALEKGYEGLRLTGNTFWLDSEDWRPFTDYEAMVDSIIGQHRMIAICGYSLDKCGPTDIIDVVSNHKFSIIRQAGSWQIIESGERKRAYDKLRESEERFRALVENTNDMVWETDTNGVYTYVSPKIRDVMGYTPEEVIGKTVFDFTTPEEGKRLAGKFRAILKSQEPFTRLENNALRKDGRPIILESSGVPFFDTDGRIYGYRGIDRDITKRKRAEEALRTSEENLRNSMDNSPLGIRIFTQDDDRKTLYANHAMLDMYGYSTVEELDDIPTKERHTPQSYAAYLERVRRRKSGEPIPAKYEISLLRKNGEVRHIAVYHGGVLWNGQRKIQLIYQDITDRKRLEEELVKAAKLESVGTLAGGIAHDFNNYLTAILGNVQLAKLYTETGEAGKASEILLDVEKASLRARDLTQRLLTFSKGGAPVRKVIRTAKVIEEAAALALSGSKVTFVFSPPDDLWALEADEGQIVQVISNIVINADQAMPRGGAITIKAGNTVIRAGSISALPEGRYVEIIIEDRGTGIPGEHLGRIFDPYFTTKQKGSGLGLATAYSIIKNHSGLITVDSELGIGTTFHIYLPASEKPAQVEEKEARAAPVRGKGRILVMDDEEAIRNMLSRMLGSTGYQVALAGDGAEAIRIYTEAGQVGEPFDAVILDLTIPGGMGGKETMKKLLEIDPGVKAIVSSGYVNDQTMAEFEVYGFRGVVPKPYRIRELQDTLRGVINGD